MDDPLTILSTIFMALFWGITARIEMFKIITQKTNFFWKILILYFAFLGPLSFLWMGISITMEKDGDGHPDVAFGLSLLLLNASVQGTISGLLYLERCKNGLFSHLNHDDDRMFTKMILYTSIALCITVVASIAALCIENIYLLLFHVFMNIVLGIVWYRLFKKYYY